MSLRSRKPKSLFFCEEIIDDEPILEIKYNGNGKYFFESKGNGTLCQWEKLFSENLRLIKKMKGE